MNEKNAMLSLKDFRIILDSWHFQHVALHGWGEPLLNPELFQMVKYAESRKISTEFTTNATLLQANIEKIITSGLSSIAFGIHKKENLPLVMPQIKELIAYRNGRKLGKPKTYIDIVIYRENRHHISDIIRAAADVGIEVVVLHRVFDIRKTGPETGYISVQDEKELFTRLRNLARKLRLKLYLPPEPSIPCRTVKNSLFVTSEGKVTPCPYLPEFYVGDALKNSLKEIISSERYLSFVRNMEEHPLCGKCPLGSTCGDFYLRR